MFIFFVFNLLFIPFIPVLFKTDQSQSFDSDNDYFFPQFLPQFITIYSFFYDLKMRKLHVNLYITSF